MPFELAIPWVTGVMLLTIRLTIVLLATPIFIGAGVPAPGRVIFVILIAIGISMGLATRDVAFHSLAGVVFAAAGEVAIGLAMTIGLATAFAVFSVAGSILDLQVGFGLSSIVDPIHHTSQSIYAQIFGLLGWALFFATDVPHELLRGIAFSIEYVPLGRGADVMVNAERLIAVPAAMLSLGFLLVAPIVLLLLLIDLILGFMSRTLPQFNVFVFSLAIKAGASVLALAIWIVGLKAMVPRIYRVAYESWGGVFL